MSFSKSSLTAHKAISAIYLMVSKIYLYRFMHLNIDQITVYQSLFINKANVNRGSRNGMTCSAFIFDRIFFILAGNQDIYYIWDESEFLPDSTKDAELAALERLKKFSHRLIMGKILLAL